MNKQTAKQIAMIVKDYVNSRHLPCHSHLQITDTSDLEKEISQALLDAKGEPSEPFGTILSVDFDKQIAEVKYNNPDQKFYFGQDLYTSPPSIDVVDELKKIQRCLTNGDNSKANDILNRVITKSGGNDEKRI